MPIPEGQNCGNCTFIDFAGPFHFYGHDVTSSDGVQIGYCRVTAPQPAQPPASQPASYSADRTSYILGVNWPEVRADDWCGHWGAPGGA